MANKTNIDIADIALEVVYLNDLLLTNKMSRPDWLVQIGRMNKKIETHGFTWDDVTAAAAR